MNRVNAVLLAVLVLCAWSVVTSQHQARKLYSELEKERKRTAQLGVEYGQLQLEQSTWGAHALIEKAAESRLTMRMPDPREVQVLANKGGQ